MRLKHSLSIFVVNSSIFLLLLSAIEFISRKIENQNILELDANSSKRLIAYKNLENQFDLLSDDCNRNYFMVSDGEDIEFADKKFSCPGVSVDDGRRVTVPSIINETRNIHIFGGSTVFGTGSIDAYTIPSLIQKKILKSGKTDIRVVNHGFASLVTKQQLRKLETADIRENDIVVFYDGGNDAFLSYIYENMDGTIVGFNRENRIPFLFSRIRFTLSKRSSFYRLLSNLKKGKSNDNSGLFCGPSFENNKANKYISNYLANLSLAKEYSDKRGAKFIHFLQPILGSGGTLKEDNYYPTVLLSGVKFDSNVNFEKCLINNFSFYYKYKSKKYRESNVNFLKNDLSRILAKGNKPESHYFLDQIHISPHGNIMVSNEIFSKIYPMIR